MRAGSRRHHERCSQSFAMPSAVKCHTQTFVRRVKSQHCSQQARPLNNTGAFSGWSFVLICTISSSKPMSEIAYGFRGNISRHMHRLSVDNMTRYLRENIRLQSVMCNSCYGSEYINFPTQLCIKQAAATHSV